MRGKLTGQACYVDDLSMPGMLHGATIRSSIPRGVIREVHFEPGVPWDEFTVVSAADIPGRNLIALIYEDQPCLASGQVNHLHEPVLLIAHENKDLLRKARSLVRIEYDPLPAVFDIDESLRKDAVIWGEDNVFKSYSLDKGDVDRIWAEAAFVVEGEYSTGAQEQLYIEPNGMVASADSESGVTVWGSLQCPFYVHKALCALFGLPSDKVRVVQQETGGAFGGKEEYPSIIAGHAALLAWKSGRPVKLIYDREEDMAATTKRHPSRTRHRTALARDGRLLAMEIEFVIDGGAYATLSSVVLSRGTIHCSWSLPMRQRSHTEYSGGDEHAPSWRLPGFWCAAVDLCARTAHGQGGAYSRADTGRVPASQSTPDGRNDRNGPNHHARDGSRSSATQGAVDAADYDERLKRFAKENERSTRKRGIGFSTFFHGAGFTGSGETISPIGGGTRTDRLRPRLRICFDDRNGPRYEHCLDADCGGSARGRIRLHRYQAARYRGRSKQRSDGRIADLHGDRPLGGNGRTRT